MGGRELQAWVDESVSTDGDGVYVLAATLCPPGFADAMRDELRRVRVSPAARVHWHSESERVRQRLLSALTASGLRHLAVVASPVDARRQERARRKCLERLYYEVDVRDVRRVWLEARGAALDRRDLRHLDGLRGSRKVAPGLAVATRLPVEEPMLWAPDAIAGAVLSAWRGRSAYLDALEGLIDVLAIRP